MGMQHRVMRKGPEDDGGAGDPDMEALGYTEL